MVKDGTFVGWVIVSRTKSPVYTLVNPVHIENIYPSGNETVVCLTSGKKLVDKRPIDRFLKAEGGGPNNLPAVAYFGSVLREVEERYKVKKRKCRVEVYPYAGTSQGRIPLSAGSKIVNRDRIVITTVNGIELGKGDAIGKADANGQIKNASEYAATEGVSGYIGTDGTYKLVFKDTELGIGVIHYEVIEE